ncbi:GtrA family protein [Dyella acidiphila]|uniref:GtrA family protein n=1 Tax=Dyella acidiphila TaxID=2775866 RepID=A0ABR9G535_9GAMM|nr:GtrA family protein [Dyella acidiphila]MBE1159145.1 GtrA family protein [Dyella acidiphila]
MQQIYLKFLKYLATGLLNTAVGLTLIYSCMAIGLSDVASNAVGYAVGICVSFFVNNKWTFEQDRPTVAKFVRFVLVAGGAYAVNLWVMLTARDVLHIDHRLAQLFGVAAYTGVSFIGACIFVFRPKPAQ